MFDFNRFTYSKITDLSLLEVYGADLYGYPVDWDTCDLKAYQDALVYYYIKTCVPAGSKILEVGGGNSRIFAKINADYECWNVDKMEGIGNGPTTYTGNNARLISAYMGEFCPELPNKYFDFAFSVSVLEHVPEDQLTFKNICVDLRRVLKPGTLSLHCLDVIWQNGRIWSNGILQYIKANERLLNDFIELPEVHKRPDIWFLSETAYDRDWRQTCNNIPYEEFGKPFTYNIFYQVN